MRLGYNWKFGPFELIDQLGTGWFADRLRRRGPAGAGAAASWRGGGTFYRVEDGRLQQLGASTAATCRRARGPRACCCSPT